MLNKCACLVVDFYMDALGAHSYFASMQVNDYLYSKDEQMTKSWG